MAEDNGHGNGGSAATAGGRCSPARAAARGLRCTATDGAVRVEAEGGASAGAAGTMFIDPHAHMISRTTDDYEAMARAGVVAVIEPAFWIGQPRTNLGSYVDYLSTIIGFEKFRAGQFGIRHYCCIGLNSEGGQQRGAGRSGDGRAAAFRRQGGRRRASARSATTSRPRSRTSICACRSSSPRSSSCRS